jgi:hypothetical protein
VHDFARKSARLINQIDGEAEPALRTLMSTLNNMEICHV